MQLQILVLQHKLGWTNWRQAGPKQNRPVQTCSTHCANPSTDG